MREESKGKGEGINEAIENKGSFQVQLSLQDGARRKMQVVSQQMARIQSYHQRRVYVVEGKYVHMLELDQMNCFESYHTMLVFEIHQGEPTLL